MLPAPARFAEAPVERLHVLDPVQERYHHALRHRRRVDAGERVLEPRRLDGQQHEIDGLLELLGHLGPRREGLTTADSTHEPRRARTHARRPQGARRRSCGRRRSRALTASEAPTAPGPTTATLRLMPSPDPR